MGINPALSFAIKCPDDLIRFLFSSTLGVLLRVSKDRVGGEQAANEGDVANDVVSDKQKLSGVNAEGDAPDAGQNNRQRVFEFSRCADQGIF